MNLHIVVDAIKNEMGPSMGCTEPVAIGLAVSRTCELLTKPAKRIDVCISSNIFKNAYSVQIPNTGTYGIELSCALGYALSKPGNTMEIFSEITPEVMLKASEILEDDILHVSVLKSSGFYIKCEAFSDDEHVTTLTQDSHDNMVYIKKNEDILLDGTKIVNEENNENEVFDIRKYSFLDFYHWTQEVDVKDLAFIKDAMDMNLNIAKLGLEKKYALGIGTTLDYLVGKGAIVDDVITDVKRSTAAASDFRMSGGNGSVMTYLGSGNQGITSTIPLAVFAKHAKVSEEKMLRGEFLAMLIIMYLKRHVGRLSPICGATLAGAGGAAGMVYLMDGTFEQICGAVQNMLGGVTGMFCDGAKGSCALKLSICAGEAVYAALYALNDSVVGVADGIVATNVEDTAKNLGVLSNDALSGLDMKVIEIMREKV